MKKACLGACSSCNKEFGPVTVTPVPSARLMIFSKMRAITDVFVIYSDYAPDICICIEIKLLMHPDSVDPDKLTRPLSACSPDTSQ